MGKIRTLAAILSILFVLVASVASSRLLLDDDKVSPSPTPNPVTSTKNNLSKSSQKPPANPSNSADPGSSTYPPPLDSTPGEQTKKNNGPGGNPNNSTTRTDTTSKEDPAKSGSPASQSKEDKEESGRPTKPENNSVVKETCDSQSTRCSYEKLVACLRRSENDSKNLSLLVQNTGDDALSVKIWGTPALHIDIDMVALLKNNSKKIYLPSNDWNVTEIVLSAGKGHCTIHIATSVPDWNLFQQFPSYATRLTPIYGAYFLLVAMVLVGGTWACCRFRKRGKRDDSGIPYQQLEMGVQPQSGSAVDSNAVDGWDDWDEDWDDEAATKPSEKHTSTSVSSNGLTSRTPKKDGWDADWDD
ncbi:uncharacterized protein LOC135677812 [Musa acuminata AAA Group]|uniref:uncharacterized protein LOC135677812 n=1 Tax=Musa acuminata AAA Group TaxID=214697 RepID=UPI0031E32F16